MSKPVPRTVQEYLDQLRAELAGADPALIQDALYDAEEYLRGEIHEHPDKTEEQVLAAVASTYGAPEEVAEAYRTTEAKVQMALRTPPPKKHESQLGRFFGIYADPRAYTAIFYMLLAMPTGIFYFTWAITGLSLSIGLMVMIFGIPFALVFLASTRLLSLIEGRLVEVMLGVRMPRRPVYPEGSSRGMMVRVKEVFFDPRTWSTLLYMLLRMPLGIFYFVFVVVIGSLSLSLVLAPFEFVFPHDLWIGWSNGTEQYVLPWIVTPFISVIGVLLLTGLMYAARGIGSLHGHLAKSLLVKLD